MPPRQRKTGHKFTVKFQKIENGFFLLV